MLSRQPFGMRMRLWQLGTSSLVSSLTRGFILRGLLRIQSRCGQNSKFYTSRSPLPSLLHLYSFLLHLLPLLQLKQSSAPTRDIPRKSVIIFYLQNRVFSAKFTLRSNLIHPLSLCTLILSLPLHFRPLLLNLLEMQVLHHFLPLPSLQHHFSSMLSLIGLQTPAPHLI